MLKATDDNDLAAQALRGDREAFSRLLERHYDRIYRIAYRYFGSAADAEDIAQTVCLTLVTKLALFGNRSRFSTWITSIAINCCRDALRQRQAGKRLAETYGDLRDMEAADQKHGQARSDWLHEAMADLEPDLRETVILIVAEGFSHAEAAAALGCAESTVSWRMHIVKKRLKAQADKADA
jgi:RNA polymerase sigma-70 factor (ECF subfamily)